MKRGRLKEIQTLDATQAEIELLDGLIESFANEFKPEAAHSEATRDGVQGAAVDEVGESAVEVSEVNPGLLGTDLAKASDPGPLRVPFPSPNFAAFRRFG